MILHCVFCQFKPDLAAAEIQKLMDRLEQFCAQVDGCTAFHAGPNRDFERKSLGYSGGFVIHFTTKDALETYANHPTHKALGAELCASCTNGADGVTVFDLET